MQKFTSLAHPNIAFIKYWGNRDQALRLPANGSISMSLAALETRTTVEVSTALITDEFTLDGVPQSGSTLQRVALFLDLVRGMSGRKEFARMASENNFPQSAGVASSASGFAALALAASLAYGLELTERELSILARRGSGSASRSIPSGFVEWHAGSTNEDSFAETIAPPAHWPLWDCVALVEDQPKITGSTEGHLLADTSPLQAARVQDAPHRLEFCRKAILERDFAALADIIELDSNMMHAVMLTSRPPLMYWSTLSLAVMRLVIDWRKAGLGAAYTLDAGPNVHVICTEDSHDQARAKLAEIPGVIQVLASPVGGGARVLSA